MKLLKGNRDLILNTNCITLKCELKHCVFRVFFKINILACNGKFIISLNRSSKYKIKYSL